MLGFKTFWEVGPGVNHLKRGTHILGMLQCFIDILPSMKGGDSHFNEPSRSAPKCRQDLQTLDGLTRPARPPKCCALR